MINWPGINNEKFIFEFTGYQFPDKTDGYDANWLFISIQIENELGSLKFKDPDFITWEIEWLHRWMENVVIGNAKEIDFLVLDGDISFHFITVAQNLYRFAVCKQFWIDGEPEKAVVNVAISEDELQSTLAYLKKASKLFPPRGKQGKLGLQFPGPQIFED